MDQRGAGYWVCSRCGGHNLRQLTSCVSCDMPASPSLRLGSGAASPQPARTASPPRPYLTPASHHASPIQPASPSYGDRSPKAANNSSYHVAAFVGDLDNKNAIIARLEQHVQSMLEQQNRQRRAHDQEISNIQAQMQHAVESHRGLLVEYRKTASDLAGKHAELALMTTEVSSLREKLTAESKRRHEEAERHLSELEDKQREIRGLKEQVANLKEAADVASDEKTRLVARSARASSVEPPQNAVALQLQITELSVRNDELAATVERLTRDLESSRNTLADIKSNHAESLDKVVRDSVLANEQAIAAISKELHNMREATENAAQRDRISLSQQLREAQDLATRLQGQLEREASRYVEKISQLENTVANLQALRDQTAEEAKFQAEILQDYTRERDQLKFEVERLKSQAKDRNVPAPLSDANTSHGGTTKPTQAPIAEQLSLMTEAVALATNSNGTAKAPLEKELTAAQDKLAVATNELGVLRGQFTTQKGIIEQLRDQLAEATRRNEAMDQALVDEISKRGTTTTVTSSSTEAEYERLKSEVFALEDELEACKAGRAIEVMELKKQLAAVTTDLEARDDELSTVTFELSRVKDAPAQVAKYKEQLASMNDRIERLEDNLAEKEKLLAEEQKKLQDTTNQLSAEKKTLEATVGKLQEELDATTIALEDAERMCRDTLVSH